MSKLLLTFYGDDFTGSTDALEQLALAGLRTALFIEPPTPAQLKQFPDLQAVGVAGLTRSLPPAEMVKELRPALKKLQALGARHIHYKVCSTFDSSPQIGSIGRAIDVGAGIFHAPFVPLLVAAPVLGRHCVFGTLFARYGTGSRGEIHRLDRHPSVSRHPVTPMREADLRWHLAQQTRKRISLFDILKVALPPEAAREALRQVLAERPEVILFDAIYPEQMTLIGELLDDHATAQQPLFSVGSSGVEMALATWWRASGRIKKIPNGKWPGNLPVRKNRARQILVGSGSCSPVTSGQIDWALKNGFVEIPLHAAKLTADKTAAAEIQRATAATVKMLQAGRSVIVHTTRNGSDPGITAQFSHGAARVLGTALGQVLRGALAQTGVRRLCIAGGDTSSFAARALGIQALTMIAPMTPGAPLCRAFAPGSPADGCELVFKGGQVGSENCLEGVKGGSAPSAK